LQSLRQVFTNSYLYENATGNITPPKSNFEHFPPSQRIGLHAS